MRHLITVLCAVAALVLLTPAVFALIDAYTALVSPGSLSCLDEAWRAAGVIVGFLAGLFLAIVAAGRIRGTDWSLASLRSPW